MALYAEGGILVDWFGKFNLFGASMHELVIRAGFAWQGVVAQKVSHRPGFAGLDHADALDTRCFLATLSPGDLELFHRCLNGTHITQDGKAHCQEGGSSICPYCDSSDSRYHRFWECERFAALRSLVPHDVMQLVPGLPECTVGYGWSLRPHTLRSWYSYLALMICLS